MNINILEKHILTTFFSSVIALIMYLLLAVIVWYTDGLQLHNEPIGILVLILVFIVPYMAIWALFDLEDKC